MAQALAVIRCFILFVMMICLEWTASSHPIKQQKPLLLFSNPGFCCETRALRLESYTNVLIKAFEYVDMVPIVFPTATGGNICIVCLI
ncbi:hypothetical protein PsYK624_159510 [Phanerochaete sordida]|uniref:Secreted protein n=1 Tax=Phanerochaete sordida TaxID=48140 RepID=A0A9P3GQ53_9APHY|nr:hypothetical protein PsYK624_159510 [Phanerochaete sordida]